MFQGLIGLVVIIALAWGISENRNQVQWKTALIGLGLQLVLALVLLKVPLIKDFFLGLNQAVVAIDSATKAGTSFVFGYLGGGDLPFKEPFPGASFILAFRALPLVLVVSALSALLFYWRILPYIVKGFSWALQKTMGIGGALGVGTAANIFVGMIEAPLFVRPYIKDMTRSEIFTLMTGGMATIAGTVLILYASILSTAIPDALAHILIASIISAPAAIVIAQLMVPETEPVTSGEMLPPRKASGAMDAIVKGTADGITLLVHIVAMLIVLVALVSLVNQVIGILPEFGGRPLTLQRLLGYLMAPVVWMLGVPWSEALAAGELMGVKVILNEFLAYLQLAHLPEGTLSPKSELIMTYAMCGFANFGSLGIMIGGLGAMAPERRDEIVSLGLKSILSGTMATCMTGAIVGLFATL